MTIVSPFSKVLPFRPASPSVFSHLLLAVYNIFFLSMLLACTEIALLNKKRKYSDQTHRSGRVNRHLPPVPEVLPQLDARERRHDDDPEPR